MKFDYFQLLKKAREEMPRKIEERKRFEMPKVVVEYHGKKTVIRNFEEICDILRRDKKHLEKFLFRELATPGYEQGGMLILQTTIQQSIIQKKLEKYVKEYVLCKICGQPDTRIVKERRITFIKCDACGAKYPVS